MEIGYDCCTLDLGIDRCGARLHDLELQEGSAISFVQGQYDNCLLLRDGAAVHRIGLDCLPDGDKMKYTKSGAVMRGPFRFSLFREWRDLSSHDDANWYVGAKNVWMPKPMVFIMLNPSTADGDVDDPTIRKCVKYAVREKFERLEVVNLFAYRATLPNEMKNAVVEAGDAYDHRGNDMVILNAVERAGLVVCAWGAHGRFVGRDFDMLQYLKANVLFSDLEKKMFALDINADGTPKHPLYCRDNIELKPMRWVI